MIRLRLFSWIAFLALAFGGVVFRAFQLQVFPTEKVARLARRQLSRRIEIVGRRGGIRDRNGKELAVSTNSISVFANPKLVKDVGRVASVLAPVLGTSEGALRRKLKESASKHFVWLERQLDFRQMEQAQNLDLKTLPGVGFLPEFRRVYPQGSLAAHVLGFSSIDGRGLEGLERRYDQELVGERNQIELRRDALGRPLFTHSEQIRLDLNHGEDMDLTLDANLQYTAERALAEAVEEHQALGGTAIVMNPHSGEILVLANMPTFDPHAPGSSPAEFRRDRAITDPIEPGSVVKPFVVARALEDKIVRPNSMISAGNGFVKVGRKVIGEAEKSHRYERLSIRDLIRVSSNVATVHLQQKMGWSRVEDTFRRLGFGSATGIELPGESRGIFPKTTDHQLLERATMSFGQGIAVTPLQMAVAYSALANGGWRVQPHLLKSSAPEDVWKKERVFTEATTLTMRRILEKVVEDEGTGVRARLESFRVAGKTGTSQRVDYEKGGYQRGAYWASFAGFVPSQNPRFVIYVMIDKPAGRNYTGGMVAAPVFARIARAALQLVPLPRDSTPSLVRLKKGRAAKESVSVVSTPSKIRQVPNLTGLSLAQAFRVLEGRGVEVDLTGRGTHVSEQFPQSGALLGSEKRIRLTLGDGDRR